MSDMSTPKELSGDILPPTSQHTELPLGNSGDMKSASAANNL